MTLAHAWDNGFEELHLPTAVVDVALAEWTSDDSMAAESQDGKTVPHRHVLAWVATGKRIPLAGPPGVEFPGGCVFGTSITAVNATTGQLITDAKYAGPPGGEGR